MSVDELIIFDGQNFVWQVGGGKSFCEFRWSILSNLDLIFVAWRSQQHFAAWGRAEQSFWEGIHHRGAAIFLLCILEEVLYSNHPEEIGLPATVVGGCPFGCFFFFFFEIFGLIPHVSSTGHG